MKPNNRFARTVLSYFPVASCVLLFTTTLLLGQPAELRVGVAAHAFDHLGAIGEQAKTAAATGATIIYASGVGTEGYQGLPPAKVFREKEQAARAYIADAKHRGIR